MNIFKVWKSVAGGVLSIIAGIIGIGGGAIVSLMGEFVSDSGGLLGFEPLGVPTIILGIVAFVGGIFALRRRVWWLALIGAIFAIPCMPVLADWRYSLSPLPMGSLPRTRNAGPQLNRSVAGEPWKTMTIKSKAILS